MSSCGAAGRRQSATSWIRGDEVPSSGRVARSPRAPAQPLLAELLAGYVAEAGTASSEPGIQHYRTVSELAACPWVAALAAGDEAELRSLCREVRANGDKVLADSSAAWSGSVARFLDPAWFTLGLELWSEEVDHKPSWFPIGWCAAGNRGQRHALLAAALAARRLPR